MHQTFVYVDSGPVSLLAVSSMFPTWFPSWQFLIILQEKDKYNVVEFNENGSFVTLQVDLKGKYL